MNAETMLSGSKEWSAPAQMRVTIYGARLDCDGCGIMRGQLGSQRRSGNRSAPWIYGKNACTKDIWGRSS
eukprot:7528819-Pyramimonas_sp.AAC.1